MTLHGENWNSSEFMRPMPFLTTRATISKGTQSRVTDRTIQVAALMKKKAIGASNKWKQFNRDWTEETISGRGSVVLWSWKGWCFAHRSFTDTFQRSTKSTYKIGVSWIWDHKSIFQNNEGGDYNEYHLMWCTHR